MEKDKQKLQEIIELHEKNVEELQEKLKQCEADLKDAEQVKTTIMSLVQTRSFRK